MGGRPLALRWGRYVLLTPERLDKAQLFFVRHGGKIVAIARFVEGLRQANGVIAGISKMHYLRFLWFNVVGAALWVALWTGVGYGAGSHLNSLYHQVVRYELYVGIVIAAVIAALIGRWILRRRHGEPGPEPKPRPQAHVEESRAEESRGEGSRADADAKPQG